MPVIHHVGYWVDDLDTALKRWGRDLGVGSFQLIEHVPFDSFVLTVDGQRYEEVVFDHSAAFAAWGPIVVELDEVHAIDDRLAAAYGLVPGAVSHVSWVVPDVAEESARLAGLGCRLINTARSGPISVAWHDGGPLFPHPIEVHQHNDVIAGMHGRLATLRADDERLRWRATVNFMGDDQDDTATGAYGRTIERLRQIESVYDPDNVFRLNQNVQPGPAAP